MAINKQKFLAVMPVITIAFMMITAIGFCITQAWLFYWSEDHEDGPMFFALTIVVFIILSVFLVLNIIRMKHVLKGTAGKAIFKNQKLGTLVRRLNTTFGVLALLIGITFAFFSLPFYSAIYNETGPILTWGTDQAPATDITIMWRTAFAKDSQIQYGLASGNLDKSASLSEKVNWHQISLSGLAPNTTYYYKILNFMDSSVHSFKTASLTDGNFSVLLFSDTRQNSGAFDVSLQKNVPYYMKLKANQLTAQGMPHAFTIVTGDTTDYADDWIMWKSWFDDISVDSGLASSAAIVDAVGNHERGGGRDCNGVVYKSLYPVEQRPDNLFYYSFNYTQLHVTLLDPWNTTECHFWGWDGFLAEQAAWLEQDLKNCANMSFKIACMHPPPINFGNNATNRGYEMLAKVAKDYGIDAVFFGHDHSYKTALINGTYYNMIGVGGCGMKPASETGFASLEISPTQMKIKMNWLDGTDEVIGVVNA